MPINSSTVIVGEYYSTSGGQLRKVTEMPTDHDGRVRVVYTSKSINIKNRAFSPTATLANPALLDTFASDCDKRLNAAEILQLRTQNIILSDE